MCFLLMTSVSVPRLNTCYYTYPVLWMHTKSLKWGLSKGQVPNRESLLPIQCVDYWDIVIRSEIFSNALDKLLYNIDICLTDDTRNCLWRPALGHWLPCSWCWQHLFYMKWLKYGLLFLILSASLRCFCPRTLVSKNGLDMLPWVSRISDFTTD